jgi:hypothetical protein
MTQNLADLEHGALKMADRIRLEFAELLTKEGLQADAPELARDAPHSARASAEVRIYIRQRGDIVDAIEFHAYRGGVPLASPSELEDWLRATFNDVLRRQREGA